MDRLYRLQDVALSRDGSEGNYYVFSTLNWSPDSRHLAAYRVRPGYKREIPYLNSSTDQLQREYSTMVYPKPGMSFRSAAPAGPVRHCQPAPGRD